MESDFARALGWMPIDGILGVTGHQIWADHNARVDRLELQVYNLRFPPTAGPADQPSA